MGDILIKKWYTLYNYYEISIYTVYITYNKGYSQFNITTQYFKDINNKDELIRRIGKTLYNKILKDINKLNI